MVSWGLYLTTVDLRPFVVLGQSIGWKTVYTESSSHHPVSILLDAFFFLNREFSSCQEQDSRGGVAVTLLKDSLV